MGYQRRSSVDQILLNFFKLGTSSLAPTRHEFSRAKASTWTDSLDELNSISTLKFQQIPLDRMFDSMAPGRFRFNMAERCGLISLAYISYESLSESDNAV